MGLGRGKKVGLISLFAGSSLDSISVWDTVLLRSKRCVESCALQIAGPMAWPTWSPDSQYIYFVRWGINSILRVHVPDGREERVLEVPFQVAPWPFTVSPDGSLILLRQHGRYDLYSLSLTFR
jgi:Tol biopolymer transport system component